MKKKGKEKKEKDAGGSKKVSELSPPPDFIAQRMEMFDRLKAEPSPNTSRQSVIHSVPKKASTDTTLSKRVQHRLAKIFHIKPTN